MELLIPLLISSSDVFLQVLKFWHFSASINLFTRKGSYKNGSVCFSTSSANTVYAVEGVYTLLPLYTHEIPKNIETRQNLLLNVAVNTRLFRKKEIA